MNRSPQLTDSIRIPQLRPFNERSIDLTNHFADGDGDPLAFVLLANSKKSLATAYVSGTDLLVRANPIAATDSTTIELEAIDNLGGTLTTEFNVTVANSRPILIQSISDTTLTFSSQDSIEYQLNDIFSDPDADTLSFSAMTSNNSVAMASISISNRLVVALTNPKNNERARIEIIADDQKGGFDTTSFTVTANFSPIQIVQSIPDTFFDGGRE